MKETENFGACRRALGKGGKTTGESIIRPHPETLKPAGELLRDSLLELPAGVSAPLPPLRFDGPTGYRSAPLRIALAADRAAQLQTRDDRVAELGRVLSGPLPDCTVPTIIRRQNDDDPGGQRISAPKKLSR
jgi:hypothetical protein